MRIAPKPEVSSGTYTFVYLSPLHPTESMIALVLACRNGKPATLLNYPWQTTVSDAAHGLSFTFEFTGMFAIEVRKAGTGTINLWDMPASIFDGHYSLELMK